MGESEAISRSFYDRLGATGLAARTTPAWDREIVRRLTAMLLPGQQILDVGCGYGRISVPLARAGFEVVALDISHALLTAARTDAERCRVAMTWLEGSMCRIPLPDQSVDVALSLWSAFYELLHHEEQVTAVREIYRVVRSPGWGLIEGPPYTEPTEDEIGTGARRGPGHRISVDLVGGLETRHFRHDASTFDAVMFEAEVSEYDVYLDDWAGRRRQFLRFEHV